MVKVNFYDNIDDNLLEFAVIVSRHNRRWVLCKHRQRNTYECPGGHREYGETITETARRELWEETGAARYDLTPVCVYSVKDNTKETFGMLYFAEIYEFEPLPQMEIENIELFRDLPSAWTYPDIQPLLIEKIRLLYDI